MAKLQASPYRPPPLLTPLLGTRLAWAVATSVQTNLCPLRLVYFFPLLLDFFVGPFSLLPGGGDTLSCLCSNEGCDHQALSLCKILKDSIYIKAFNHRYSPNKVL